MFHDLQYLHPAFLLTTAAITRRADFPSQITAYVLLDPHVLSPVTFYSNFVQHFCFVYLIKMDTLLFEYVRKMYNFFTESDIGILELDSKGVINVIHSI